MRRLGGGAKVLALLRKPLVIVLEVAALGVVGAVAVALPQSPDDEAVGAFLARWPTVGRVTAALRLHEVTTTGWFLAVVAVALASLLVVQVDQWRRLRLLWGQRPDPRSMARASYRRVAPASACKRVPEAPRFRVTGRLGLLGSPTF